VNRTIYGRPMDEASIDVIQHYVASDKLPVIVAFSGGKDSVVTLDLVRRSGVEHRVVYNLTTGDPPELVQFIRRHYPDAEWSHPKKSYWRLIEEKGLPSMTGKPGRFCCTALKEQKNPPGHLIITGIRYAESHNRRSRAPHEEGKHVKNQRLLHPIYNWLDGDVWTYIRERGLPYCSVYDEGWHRLGCVICCYNTRIRQSIARWPKLAAAAQRALARKWASGRTNAEQLAIFPKWQDYWEWWLRRTEKGEPYPEAQCDGLFA